MVYNQKFIAVVKVNGKVLREQDDLVTLPFGSDYSILLKNLESRRASVSISIDSKDVLDGHSLIVNPNSEIELKGFMDKGVVRNSFRFIQKTQEISEHRGDNVDDGFIRIEFAFEKEKPEIIRKTILHDHVYNPFGWTEVRYGSSAAEHDARMKLRGISGGVTGQSTISSALSNDSIKETSQVYSSQVVSDSLDNSIPTHDEGITVKGAETHQGFREVKMGDLEQSQVIIIRLKGTTSKGIEVEKPITVKTKIECPTCGKKSKSHVKFCANCGTFIQ